MHFESETNLSIEHTSMMIIYIEFSLIFLQIFKLIHLKHH